MTLHRAKGLEWDAVFLPSLEEGLLPVAQAKDDEALLDEERRLLYVGLTRARVHLALSWAQKRVSARAYAPHRLVSRFVRDLMPSTGRAAAVTSRAAPASRPRQERTAAASGDGPVMAALRAWRLERARADAVPPYVIAHDTTLAAIVEREPRSLSELARVPGIGPAKLDKYGAEIVAILQQGR